MRGPISIAKRFSISSGLCLALLAVLAGLSVLSLRTAQTSTSVLITGVIPKTRYCLGFVSDINRVRGDYLRHLATKNKADLPKVESMMAVDRSKLESDYQAYGALLDTEEERSDYAELGGEIETFNREWEKVLPLSRTSQSDDALTLYLRDAFPYFLKVEVTAKRMADKSREVGDAVATRSLARGQRQVVMAEILGVGSLLIGVLVSWFMALEVKRSLHATSSTLHDASDQVVSAASEVSSASQALAQGSSQQAASLEETSASAHEIQVVAQHNMQNALTTATIV